MRKFFFTYMAPIFFYYRRLNTFGQQKQAAERLPVPGKNETALAQAFLREHIAEAAPVNALFAGKVISAPEELPPLQGVRVLRVGLQIGEAKGKIFLPDHALALACRAARPFALDEAQALRYLAGETLEVPDSLRGYHILTFAGWNLGWGKASSGQMKNHYPKGLRRQNQ